MNCQLNDILGEQRSGRISESSSWAPSVDIRETEDALLVQAELPGIEKKDIQLEVKDGVLSISGERKYEQKREEENIHRVERAYGRFFRSFSLPRNVNSDRVEASMKDGILTVRLPKHEHAKPRAIEIH